MVQDNFAATPANIAFSAKQFAWVDAVDMMRPTDIQRNPAVLVNTAPDSVAWQPSLPGHPLDDVTVPVTGVSRGRKPDDKTKKKGRNNAFHGFFRFCQSFSVCGTSKREDGSGTLLKGGWNARLTANFYPGKDGNHGKALKAGAVVHLMQKCNFAIRQVVHGTDHLDFAVFFQPGQYGAVLANDIDG